jgi:8-oxo-dGTP pyrophosphatase MutT (NUDIX family)
MANTYGIICLRKRKEKWEGLMVSRLVSYAYSDFVIHRYDWPIKPDDQHKTLQKMFNNMTVRERSYIASLNFNHIWFLRWMSDPELCPQIQYRSKLFAEKQELFRKRFINGNNREKLIKALASSGNISPLDLYEFPKGHHRESESQLISALREFEEETHLKRIHFKLITATGRLYDYSSEESLTPIRYDITGADNNQLYTTYFYVAITDTPIQPSVTIDGNHPIEVADIHWVDVHDGICKKYKDILASAVQLAEIAQHQL